MFSRKYFAALLGLIGGLAAASTGIAYAHVAGGAAPCTHTLQGDVVCVQHIEGKTPGDGGTIPHQETCLPVESLTLPAATGNGTTQLGPKVTCSTATSETPQMIGRQREPLDLRP
ncbi:hypothetical protein ACIRP7_09940 [Streptomyces sp. NPDC102270]|uniref:hypothetical protein n=1 Tax=Streptomyces sp. NPDC102270 TaxID=3366150 RepID=UPI00380B8260